MCVTEAERKVEKKQEVSDSHVLELGHLGLLCQNILMPTLPIVKQDNLGRQIGVTTIKLDASFTHKRRCTHISLHSTNHFDICIGEKVEMFGST